MFALTLGQQEIPPMAQKEATELELQAIPLQHQEI
jgi:hypothetical protein